MTTTTVELRRKLRRARKALRWVKRDCEICDWHCHVCGADQGAKEFDLYHEVVAALRESNHRQKAGSK